MALQIGQETVPHAVTAACVRPGEELNLTVVAPVRGERYSVEVKAGTVTEVGPASWRWRAPGKPGIHPIRVAGPNAAITVVNALVVWPFESVANGELNGFRIGTYPRIRGRRRPLGFVEVTKANAGTRLSPHFQLGQFVSKQAGGYPKYLLLDERLLLKLEALLAAFNATHHPPAKTLHVMSGYRTPYYNHNLENVTNSQHVWGSAADVFVDRNGNGVLDDLDGDGRTTLADARVLFALVDRLDHETDARWVGGLGLYPTTAAHGPFVHVDVRGTIARWGH